MLNIIIIGIIENDLLLTSMWAVHKKHTNKVLKCNLINTIYKFHTIIKLIKQAMTNQIKNVSMEKHEYDFSFM